MRIAKRIRQESGKLLEIISHINPSDIPSLGRCLNYIDSLPLNLLPDDHPMKEGIPVIRKYIERLILEEEKDVDPLVSCVEQLCVTDDYNETNIRELTSGLALRNEPDWFSDTDSGNESGDYSDSSGHESRIDDSDEDVQILNDFIVEAMDSIDSLECSLVDFEADSSNHEIINSIFRTFHTIKGVSGFLNLKNINSLSHSTENLLDDIRQGSLKVSRRVLDVIFEAVDALKKLITEKKHNIENGFPWNESQADIRGILVKIEEVGNAGDDISDMPIGEILVLKGIVRKDDLEESLEIQKMTPGTRIGEILVENNKADADSINSVARAQQNDRAKVVTQVKIDTSKLDSLVDMTGELVIAQSMLRQYSQKHMASDPQLFQFISRLSSSVSGIQKIAMTMRMVPIRSTFHKMVRVIRDLSKSSGKEIVLRMTGEETEIDRNMVDALYEPMVHMIRNSADHGIEVSDERLMAGKPAYGTISLSACHKGGNIVIELEDDGRGLCRDKIIEKAVSKGLIKSSESMADEQIFNLIFEPGFSTASEITDISGRGVGMDVVRLAIERMKGSISIRSVQGKGCVFSISLPLTMGIIEGMIIRSGSEKYIIPTLSIIESFRPDKNDYKTSFERGEMLLVRGSLVPLVRLGRVFGVNPDIDNPWEGIIIVLEDRERRIGVLVDDVLGKDELVIKSLGDAFVGIKGIAGGSILGDGKVSLIIDVSGLFDTVYS